MTRFIFIFILLGFGFANLSAQISPGPLSEVHAHLEGLSNCTQCHDLGHKVTNEKCLSCHSLLNARIIEKKGFHVSTEVKGKDCVTCHNEHHGRKFEILRFDTEKFDHRLTGYTLEGAHTKKKCKDCHKTAFIQNPKVKEKKFSYLGLNTACAACHEDYHQKTLKGDCEDCHGFDAFRPAPKFEHSKTNFQLKGKHQSVDCKACHKISTRNEKPFQEFAGLRYENCSACHKDVHNNQFGPNCKDCHSEQSFQQVQGLDKFDHSKTKFELQGKHKSIDCKACHKTRLTDPLPFAQCSDCHKDYHKGDFIKENATPDCAECHTVNGFQPSTYTLDKHQKSSFPLEGAHLATPCFACHKKPERWAFKDIGGACKDCHNDIHAPFLDEKYYPGKDCKSCHNVNRWSDLSFDHSKTSFKLEGKHKEKQCRDCHFVKDAQGKEVQRFSKLGTECIVCHKDNHYGQFEVKGVSECLRCHGFEDWKASRFNHQLTRFPLEGKHSEISCDKCHKKVQREDVVYVQYKMEDIKCAACH